MNDGMRQGTKRY